MKEFNIDAQAYSNSLFVDTTGIIEKIVSSALPSNENILNSTLTDIRNSISTVENFTGLGLPGSDNKGMTFTSSNLSGDSGNLSKKDQINLLINNNRLNFRSSTNRRG